MADLLRLPGVARKTANVVLGNAFGIVEGVVVDTHVGRISRRLGFTTNEDPQKVEADLMAIVPRAAWLDFSHQLILHGRAVCKAPKPWCDRCMLTALCPSMGTF
jgi:endonuclease-3